MNPNSATRVTPRCPLCQAEAAILLDRFPVKDLCREYMKQLGIHISKELPPDIAVFDLLCCERCGLEYFWPLVTGSSDFYAKLAAQANYYSEARWEFAKAKTILAGCKSVLDIGCGDGIFLSLLPQNEKLGLEFNPLAAARAREKGLLVEECTLSALKHRKFDAVTMFHVLEHVDQPVQLLQEALDVLAPGGYLVISTPNNDSFIGRDLFHAANAPPHHPLRWKELPFQFLPKILAVDLCTLENEPLNSEYVFFHRRVLIADFLKRWGIPLPLMKRTLLSLICYKASNFLTRFSLKLKPALPSGRKGFAILAVYRKKL
jgi:SAM-dependent methyltransferase